MLWHQVAFIIFYSLPLQLRGPQFVHTNLPKEGFELLSLGPQAGVLPAYVLIKLTSPHFY